MEINILVIIVLAFMIFKIWDGYNKGMVKEIISFISLIFLCLFVVLAGNGLSSYLDGRFLNVAVMTILLAVLGIAQHIVNVLVLPAKFIAKLPVVKSMDKVLGVAVGFLETVLLLWTVYTLVMMMDLGMIGDYILQCTAENPVLTWLYQHNYLAYGIELLLAEFDFVPLILQ